MAPFGLCRRVVDSGWGGLPFDLLMVRFQYAPRAGVLFLLFMSTGALHDVLLETVLNDTLGVNRGLYGKWACHLKQHPMA